MSQNFDIDSLQSAFPSRNVARASARVVVCILFKKCRMGFSESSRLHSLQEMSHGFQQEW